MYAVIHTGGKQERVQQGQVLDVERLGSVIGDDVELRPVLVVDGDRVLATPAELSGASVTARVVGDAKGPKITGFTYKNKTNQRRRWGHRQRYHTIEITGISVAAQAPAGPASSVVAGSAKPVAAKSGDE